VRRVMVPGIMADDRNREGHASQEEGSEVHGLLPVTHHGVDAVCTSRGAGPWSARLGFSPGTASPSRRSPGRVFGTRDRSKRVARAEPRAQKDGRRVAHSHASRQGGRTGHGAGKMVAAAGLPGTFR